MCVCVCVRVCERERETERMRGRRKRERQKYSEEEKKRKSGRERERKRERERGKRARRGGKVATRCCSTQQHTATHCKTLQTTATHKWPHEKRSNRTLIIPHYMQSDSMCLSIYTYIHICLYQRNTITFLYFTNARLACTYA